MTLPGLLILVPLVILPPVLFVGDLIRGAVWTVRAARYVKPEPVERRVVTHRGSGNLTCDRDGGDWSVK